MLNTVTQIGWNCGVQTGSDFDGAILEPFRVINDKIYHGSQYGRKFPDSESAWKFALTYGYIRPYYRRSWCATCNKVHSFLDRECPDRFKSQ